MPRHVAPTELLHIAGHTSLGVACLGVLREGRGRFVRRRLQRAPAGPEVQCQSDKSGESVAPTMLSVRESCVIELRCRRRKAFRTSRQQLPIAVSLDLALLLRTLL
jgi:hypothetical protein